MKLYLAIFAALLCATAVVGEDEGRWFNFKCVGDILKEDVSPEVKALWAEYHKKLQEIHDNDWEKCKKIDNIAEMEKCKTAVIVKSMPIYSEFFKKLVKIADWEKVKEIRKKIGEKCVKTDVDILMVGDESPELSYDLFALFETLAFEERHSDYWLNLKCAWGILAEMASTEVKDLYAEYREKMNDLREKDWEKCKKIDNIAEQQKCKLGVMEKGIDMFFDFLTKVVKVASWDTVHKIQKKVHDKCVKRNAFGSEECAQASADTFSLPDQFQCITDVLGDVSQRNNLGELWEKYQPSIQLHLDKWKKCAEIENKFRRILCNIGEGFTVFSNINSYARALAAEKPDLIQEITRELQEKCGSNTDFADFVNFDTDALDNGFIEKMKCIKKAIDDAMKESDYSEPWKQLKEKLEKLGDRIKACKQENMWESLKCVGKEIKGAKDDIKSFLDMMNKLNKDTYERIMKYIKERCKE